MTSVAIYLNFDGTTEEAFTFYQSVFGGDFTTVMRFKDINDPNIPAEVGEKIMHIGLPLSESVILMATDAMEWAGQKLVAGNNFYVALTADSRDEADRLFAALSENGKVEMPMQDMFWGDYHGSLCDKYGVQWMISFPIPKA